MNDKKLQQLSIDSGAKQRSHTSVWMILIGVIVITAVALYYWWPRESDKVRLVAGKTSSTATGSVNAASTNALPFR